MLESQFESRDANVTKLQKVIDEKTENINDLTFRLQKEKSETSNLTA